MVFWAYQIFKIIECDIVFMLNLPCQVFSHAVFSESVRSTWKAQAALYPNNPNSSNSPNMPNNVNKCSNPNNHNYCNKV